MTWVASTKWWSVQNNSKLQTNTAHGMRRWFLWRKMYHDFWVCLGGGKDPLNIRNRDIAGFCENARFVRSNGWKTTFKWPKVVSEVITPRFWGVVCVEKCFWNFEIVIGSAVSEKSRFARFYVKSQYLRNVREKKCNLPFLLQSGPCILCDNLILFVQQTRGTL